MTIEELIVRLFLVMPYVAIFAYSMAISELRGRIEELEKQVKDFTKK